MFIVGYRYSQEKLKPSFVNFIGGQSKLIKLLFLLAIALFYIVLSFVTSYQGGGIIFSIVLDTPYKAVFLIVTLVTLVWLISTVFWNWRKGIGLASLLSVLIIIFAKILDSRGLLGLNPDFLITSIGNIIVQLAVCGVFLGAFRFFLALTEILFLRSKPIQLLIILPMLLTAVFTSLLVFSLGLQREEFVSREKLGAISDADYISLSIMTVLGGVGLILLLQMAAWAMNRNRKVPWCYPDLIRDLAISVGSWGGTSFYNLDLSNISFAGAKLANTDLRAKKLYRTCFQDVVGLARARVDNQYLDLTYPKVQTLLTHGSSQDLNFQKINLQGAFLQNADMRGFNLTDTNLTDADLKGADLRGSTLIRTQLAGVDLQGVDLRRNNLMDANLTEANLREADLRDCILVRTQVARADFAGADMTGICIEDWSVSSKTNFTNVRCDYIYRRYQDRQPIDRYPIDRNFEPGEFASLFQQPENELELVFKGEFDYTALSLTFDKLQTDKPDLKLKLQGIEQRHDLWVVKVISDDPATVESRIQEIQDAVYQGYEVTTTRLENNPLIRRIISDVANIRKTQEETVEEVKQLTKRIGSNFYFLGGTITNVTGAGEINYTEASNQVRNLVSSNGQHNQAANTLLNQLRSSNVANTATEQVELIQFVILEEAQRDPRFKQSLLQQEAEILASLPESSIALAIRGAIAQLNLS